MESQSRGQGASGQGQLGTRLWDPSNCLSICSVPKAPAGKATGHQHNLDSPCPQWLCILYYNTILQGRPPS